MIVLSDGCLALAGIAEPNKSVKGTRRPLAVLEFGFYQGSAASLKLSERRAPYRNVRRHLPHWRAIMFVYRHTSSLSLIVLSIFVTLLQACTVSPQDALVGSYTITENGKQREFVRITKKEGKYYFSANNGQWSEPKEIMPVAMAKYELHFDKKSAGDIQGLGHKFVGIFKVPKGFKSGSYLCKTGYVMAFMLGAIDLQKM